MPTDAERLQRVIVVGLPAGLRSLLEHHFAGKVLLRTLLLQRQGGYRLEPRPHVAIHLIEQFADAASSETGSYQELAIVVLPYPDIPEEVKDTIKAIEELGATVIRPTPGTAPWPSRSPRLDQTFQDQMRSALIRTISDLNSSPEQSDPVEEVMFELLRGLARHSKMGPNNHSHEDDLWKARGKALGPGGKREVLNRLLSLGLLDRKPNDSAGGKGWVYWIGDVAQARERYPALEPYLR